MSLRPEFHTAVAALRCANPHFSWVKPTEEELEIAATLEEIATYHQPTAAEPDDVGDYGLCTGCRDPWPCEAWQVGTELAVQWLGRAADRVYAHAQSAMQRLNRGGAA